MNVKYPFQTIPFSLLILLTITSLSLVACSEKTDESAATGAHVERQDSGNATRHDEHGEEQIVRLSDETLREFGIAVATAGPGVLQIHRKLTGEIVIEPDRLAHIYPRFPGIVKEVRKHIGDKVKAGEVLAVIESNESLVPYEVISLIDGTVTDKHLSLGEVITDDSHPFTITDLTSVWANLSVYQKDLPYIKVGQIVRVSAGQDAPETSGKISYISPIVDEKTRTATARVVLANPKGAWRPGLFVTGLVETDAIKADVVIPRTALETIDDQTIVFVQTDEGFEPRTVALGRNSTTHVEIQAGLAAGERYVSSGGFTLKAELGKESFESGHAH